MRGIDSRCYLASLGLHVAFPCGLPNKELRAREYTEAKTDNPKA